MLEEEDIKKVFINLVLSKIVFTPYTYLATFSYKSAGSFLYRQREVLVLIVVIISHR